MAALSSSNRYWVRRPIGATSLRTDNHVCVLVNVVVVLVDELFAWMAKTEAEVLPKGPMGRALAYALKLETALRRFLDDGRLEADNNAAERSIRPLKIGNKNWLFIGSRNGGDTCAVMTSLLQSARNLGLNPQEYLENVMRRLPYTSKEDLHELLPHKWQKKINPRSPYLPPDYRIS